MKTLINWAISLRNSLNKLTDDEFVSQRAVGERIPKIIHQTYHTRLDSPEFPKPLKDNLDALQAQNPSWEMRFYDDADIERYIAENFPELSHFYGKIDHRYGAARADFFRYLVIYNEGGIYLDIKSGAARPLDEILFETDRILLSHWPRSWPKNVLGQHPGITNPIGELQQWYIASVPGHPFLKSVINNVCYNMSHYNPIIHDYGSWGVFNLTGPIAFTEAIYPLLEEYPHRLEQDHLQAGLVYCATGPEASIGHHHTLFTKTHYNKLKVPILRMPLHIRLMFMLLRPGIEMLKQKHNANKGR